MKTLPIVLLVTATLLRGADVPLPEFKDSIIGHPPLSLGESSKFTAKPHTFTGSSPLLAPTPKLADLPRAAPKPRFSLESAPGQMPVLRPDPSVDYKIVRQEPDPTVDFKMLIRPGDLERSAGK